MRQKTIKIISFILCLCMIITPLIVVSNAADTTIIEYTVDEEYTVTIPEYILATPQTEETVKYDVVAETVYIPYGYVLDVSINFNEELVHIDDATVTLDYDMYKEFDDTTSQIYSGYTVLQVNAGEVEGDSSQVYAKLTSDVNYAGTYIDTATFTSSVRDYVSTEMVDYYYSALNLAVTDINNGTLGENADVEELEDAVAGIYTDNNGNASAVLLKDSVEDAKVAPSVDMTINLYGNTLSVNKSVAIDVVSGNVIIDGRTDESAIIQTQEANVGRCIQSRTNGTLTVLGGTYKIISNCASNAVAIFSAMDTVIMDVDVYAENTNLTSGLARGIWCPNGNDITISDSSCVAVSIYGGDGTSYSGYSQGISCSDGSLTLNNCYAKGTLTGVSLSYTDLIVNGGIYEGYGHGGFYTTGDENTITYISNATIRECDWFGLGDEPYNYDNQSAAYFCGSEGTGNDNITGTTTSSSIYIDNCVFEATKCAFVLRSSNGECGNKAYISNSTIGETPYIRIDNADPAHTLYIGENCDFTAERVVRAGTWDTDTNAIVVETNENYNMVVG